MSKIHGIFFKDQKEQTPEERMLALRLLFGILGIAALVLFVGFLVTVFMGDLERIGPAAEIEELGTYAKGGFIGIAGFAFLAMAFGKRYIYQILMFVATLAAASIVFYLGWKYANPMIQVFGGAGFAVWITGQAIVTFRGIKKILSGDDVLLTTGK